MTTGPLLLLNAVLAVVALTVYHLVAPMEAPGPGETAFRTSPVVEVGGAGPDPALLARLDANARRLAALETSVYALRRELSEVRLAVHTGETREQYMSAPRLAALERMLGVVRGRRLFERREHNLHVAVKELQLGLTEVERRSIVELIQASHDEVGRHAAKLRESGARLTSDELNAGYDEILKRYHEKVRALLAPAQAEALIARFLPLR